MTLLAETTDAEVNEEAVLGVLINRCGKMRMLSHRVVVTLLLQSGKDTPCSKGLEGLEKNLLEFSQIAAEVLPGSATSTLPKELRHVLEQVSAVSPSQAEDITRFVSTARSIQQRLTEPRGAALTQPIEELADFVTTTLLDTLNAIVEGIGRALDHVVSHRQSQSGKQTRMIRSSITELEKISRMIMIISVNASIEASRVGEAGRGFSAVATEIRGLSQAANKVISSLRADYEGAQ
ncbi:MAG: methyl-accepting chemotaxis protein [Pelagibaca sp.]